MAEGRIGCDHVSDGAPVAGFTTITVNGRTADGTIITLRAGSSEILLDLCAECIELVRVGLNVHYNHDRRHGQTRQPSSTAERSVSDRETQHGHSVPEGSTPAVASNPLVDSWDEHR